MPLLATSGQTTGQSPGSLAAVLVTGIADPNELARELGEAAWGTLSRKHHALVRRELRRWRGVELGIWREDCLAVFDQPARAIRCSCAIREAAGTLGLEIRSAVHLAELGVEAWRVGSAALGNVAHMAAAARPGDVMVSPRIRDLLSGAGFAFEEREGKMAAVAGLPLGGPGSLLPWWVPAMSRRQALLLAAAVLVLVLAGGLYVVFRVWP